MTAPTHTATIAAASTANSRKRFTLVLLAVIALFVSATSALTYTHLNRIELLQFSNEAGTQLGALKASRKVRCIMPPAWRKDCSE